MTSFHEKRIVERISDNYLQKILASADFLVRFNEAISIANEHALIASRDSPDPGIRQINTFSMCFPIIDLYKEPLKEDVAFYHLHHKKYVTRWPGFADIADRLSDEYLRRFPRDSQMKSGYILMRVKGIDIGNELMRNAAHAKSNIPATESTLMRIDNIRYSGLDTHPILVEITNSPYCTDWVYFTQDIETEPPIKAAEEAEHQDKELERIFKEIQILGETKKSKNLKRKAINLFLQGPKMARERRIYVRFVRNQWENLQEVNGFDFDIINCKPKRR